MPSAIKIWNYCLCLVLLSSGIAYGGHHDTNSMIEPLLVAGMVAMMLKKKKHGYSGRSPRHHQPPPPDVPHPMHRGQGHVVQGHIPPPHAPQAHVVPGHVRQAHIVQGHVPQAHVVQEYAPSHGGARYEEEAPHYQEETNEAEYPQARYIVAREQPSPEARYVIAQPGHQPKIVVSSTHHVPHSRFVQTQVPPPVLVPQQRFVSRPYGR